MIKSSKGDGSISRTIKGAVVLITLIFASLNIDIPEALIYQAVEAVALALSAGYTAYGILAKIYNRVSKKKI